MNYKSWTKMTSCFSPLRILSVSIGVFLTCMILPAASVGEKSPQQVVEDIFEKASRSSIAKSKKLQNQVNSHFDFIEMGRSVLGKRYQSLSSQDREWFVATLRKIISKSVYPNALDFFKGVNTTYEQTKITKTNASLLSILEKKGEETEILYSFRLQSQRWKLVDVSIDDESWVENIRDEVQSILKREKWRGLKKRLNARLAKIDRKKK